MDALADLRRQRNAARFLYNADDLRGRFAAREVRAFRCLDAALGARDSATVPGYRVIRDGPRLIVTPCEPVAVDQLAAWTEGDLTR